MLELITQILSTFGEVITVAITGFSAWVGYKQLQKRPEQISTPVLEPAPIEPGTIDESTGSSLIVFESDIQTTTLRANSSSLECYLFDSRPGKISAVQWRLSAPEVRKILDEHNFEVNPGYKIKTGTFRIGERRNWLYSKLLFPEPALLEEKLNSLLNTFNKP